MLVEKNKIAYTIGALMYTPAINDKVVETIITNKVKGKYSLCLCLEDSINDNIVEKAEEQIVETLKKLKKAMSNSSTELYLPKIFIRVRTAEQIKVVFNKIKDNYQLITGFVLPKYSLECGCKYNLSIREINENLEKKLYIMPILESSDIIELDSRVAYLTQLKKKIDEVEDIVLNVRVGGNDFCKEFKVRRNYSQTIYDIAPVRDILSDILTVFSRDYVVSGPVWEYFMSPNNEWRIGLEKEMELDKLNGFIGKTVIHPNQIEVINRCLMVEKSDYEDALEIVNWNDSTLAVGKSHSGERMNEVKVHLKWAEKILILGTNYGVK